MREPGSSVDSLLRIELDNWLRGADEPDPIASLGIRPWRPVLEQVLASGDMPPAFAPHLTHLLDEAPVPTVVMAVEEAAAHAHLPPRQVWRNVAKLAQSLSVHRRALWA